MKKVKKTIMVVVAGLILGSCFVCSAFSGVEVNKKYAGSMEEIPRDIIATVPEESTVAGKLLPVEIPNTEDNQYSIHSEGVRLIERADENGNIRFELVAEEEFGRVDVLFDNGQKSSVYTYQTDGKVFVSNLSKDTAWRLGKKYEIDGGLITEDEFLREYEEYTDHLVQAVAPQVQSNTENIPMGILASGDTYVKGKLEIETAAGGTVTPVRLLKVELCARDGKGNLTSLGKKCMDENGEFYFGFDNTDGLKNGELSLCLRWFPESDVFTVAQNIINVGYIDSHTSFTRLTTGELYEFNEVLSFDGNSDVYKSFYIANAMVVGQRFADAMGTQFDRYMRVTYPAFDGSTSFSWSGDVGAVKVSFCGIAPSDYNRWDTLIHEFGHFVEFAEGIYPHSLVDVVLHNSDLGHYSSADHFEDKDDKELAMVLTWSEAWATAFALIAQQYYVNDYVGVPYAGDMHYNGIYYVDYEFFAVDENSCEAQEDAVIAFLWDVYDSSPNETDDYFSLGHDRWWDLTTRTGTLTLTDFVDLLIQEERGHSNEIGLLLGKHQIAPSNMAVKNLSSLKADTAPIVQWKVNGSVNNPNNLFRVVFYNSAMFEVYESEDVPHSAGHQDTKTHIISLDEWTHVLQEVEGQPCLYIAVKGYNNNDPVSGPYVSNFQKIQLDDDFSLIPQWSKNVIQRNALCFCSAQSVKAIWDVGFSTNGVFHYYGGGEVWYHSESMAYLPLQENGYPYYRYVAAFAGGTLATGYDFLSEPYSMPSFATPVTRDTSEFIPTSYDIEDGTDKNVWPHNGGSKDTILGTIAYNGHYYDFELDIPWIGYKSVEVKTGQYKYIGGENVEIVFTVRTGPNRVSVIANEKIFIGSSNAFAFRLK